MATRWRKTQLYFNFVCHARTNVEVDLDQDDKDVGKAFKNNILEIWGRGSNSKGFSVAKLEGHLDEVG